MRYNGMKISPEIILVFAALALGTISAITRVAQFSLSFFPGYSASLAIMLASGITLFLVAIEKHSQLQKRELGMLRILCVLLLTIAIPSFAGHLFQNGLTFSGLLEEWSIVQLNPERPHPIPIVPCFLFTVLGISTLLFTSVGKNRLPGFIPVAFFVSLFLAAVAFSDIAANAASLLLAGQGNLPSAWISTSVVLFSGATSLKIFRQLKKPVQ